MKRYRLRGMLWQQSPLTYGEFKRLWTLTRGTGLSASVMSAQGFGKWVDKLVEEDLLPQVIAIILKPYEPTPLHRWWNRWQAKRHNVLSVADVISATPEFAAVMRDFLLLNVSWIESWLNTPQSSDSKGESQTPGNLLRGLIGSLWTLVGATSAPQSGSPAAPPQKSSAGE